MNKYKVIVVDDELLILEELSSLLQQHKDIEVIGEMN